MNVTKSLTETEEEVQLCESEGGEQQPAQQSRRAGVGGPHPARQVAELEPKGQQSIQEDPARQLARQSWRAGPGGQPTAALPKVLSDVEDDGTDEPAERPGRQSRRAGTGEQATPHELEEDFAAILCSKCGVCERCEACSQLEPF